MNNYCKFLCTLAEICIVIGVNTVITNDKIKWEVNTANIILGHPVTLKCVVPENTCPENYVRRWFGGPEKKLLCINNNSSNRTKYKMSAVDSTSSFELIIYNFDESDIECEYECSCGFDDYRNILTLQQIKEKLKYPLDWWTMNHSISLENDRLNVQMVIYKVYPIPICRLLLNEAVYMDKINFTAIYRNSTLFPVVNFTEQITFNRHLHIVTVKIECFDHISNSFSLVVNDTVLNVGKRDVYSETLHLHVIFILIGVLVCLVILAYYIHRRKGQLTQLCGTFDQSGIKCRNQERAKEENITSKTGSSQEYPMIKEPFLMQTEMTICRNQIYNLET